MLGRRLALVAGLTVGDYLLWNWSLNHNRGALALFSGLTLPPLTIALAWVLVLIVARTLARYPAWHTARARHGARAGTAYARARRSRVRGGVPADPAARRAEAPSDKIAA